MVEEVSDDRDVVGDVSDTLEAETAEERSDLGAASGVDEWQVAAGESDGQASDDASSKKAIADGSDILGGSAE